jgi:hypothetical protein
VVAVVVHYKIHPLEVAAVVVQVVIEHLHLVHHLYKHQL